MKKIFLSTIVLFLISLSVSAQNYRRDIVYLKNGSIIKGEIIEQVPSKTLTIQTADGSSFVYNVDDILKITKEKQVLYKEKQSNNLKQVVVDKPKGSPKFNYYSFNVGAGNSFNANLAELNFAGQSGFGGMVKLGGSIGINDSDYSLAYLAVGPSYSFSAGSTIGVVSLMTGIGNFKYEQYYYDGDYGYYMGKSETIALYGINYTHRFFTNKNWNLLLGADFISGFGGLNIGFAYSW